MLIIPVILSLMAGILQQTKVTYSSNKNILEKSLIKYPDLSLNFTWFALSSLTSSGDRAMTVTIPSVNNKMLSESLARGYMCRLTVVVDTEIIN
jgi:hypothetical protein